MLSVWTGIPVYKLTEEETQKLLRMEDELHKRVIGQESAIKAVSQAIRRTRAGLKDPKRPSGSFIFLGPSGVGKTELAKTLAEFLFGDEQALIALDMSEYMEKHTVSRLVGSPPGYVGYEEGGQLTEAVRRKPFSVVLFDEIEKAHPDVFNTLLQILEEGRLTDAQGRSVDFRNTVLIMTSNLGTADLRKANVGFGKADEAVTYERMKEKVNDALKQHFRPEFLNRIDETIVFHELSKAEVIQIVDLMIRRVSVQLEGQGLGLELTPGGQGVPGRPRATTPRSAPGRCGGPSSAWSRTRCPSGCCTRSSAPARSSSSTSSPTPTRPRATSDRLPRHRGLRAAAGSSSPRPVPPPGGVGTAPHRPVAAAWPRLLFVVAVVAAVVATTAGCRVRTQLAVDVEEDGSGMVTVAVGLDADAVDRVPALDQELRLDDLEAAGWEVTGPSAEDDGLTWFRATKGSPRPRRPTRCWPR